MLEGGKCYRQNQRVLGVLTAAPGGCAASQGFLLSSLHSTARGLAEGIFSCGCKFMSMCCRCLSQYVQLSAHRGSAPPVLAAVTLRTCLTVNAAVGIREALVVFILVSYVAALTISQGISCLFLLPDFFDFFEFYLQLTQVGLYHLHLSLPLLLDRLWASNCAWD